MSNGSKPTPTATANKLAVGTLHRDATNRSVYDALTKTTFSPIFQRWVVLEVIFDPTFATEQKILDYQESIGTKIINAGFVLKTQIPRNTIIARPVLNDNLGNRTAAETAVMFLYPFFPSHISLPCKVGEHIWVMFEHIDKNLHLGYWVCSIVGPGHVEDVNHSHFNREYDSTFVYKTNAQTEHNNVQTKPRYHFANGIYTRTNSLLEDEVVLTKSATLVGSPSAYKDLLTETDAARASVYESVPRFKKRPGDLAFEGSNNTLIVLGRDRTGSVATYIKNQTSNDDYGEVLNTSSVDLNEANAKKKNAGSIDIVAGRGQTPKTGGSVVLNELGNEELAKHDAPNVISQSEGDPDFKNDRSRVYVSQRTSIDAALGESFVQNNSKRAIKDSEEGDAGIIIKSDKIRIIARSDLQIIVTDFTKETQNLQVVKSEPSVENSFEGPTTFETKMIKNEKSNPKNWASVTIKKNGDIIFEPSDMGYIKLGGEDANRGIVCSTQPVIASNGGVAGKSLLTTAGGQIAGSTLPTPQGNKPALLQDQTKDLGTYANKVLIK